jgi:hypothetical protein
MLAEWPVTTQLIAIHGLELVVEAKWRVWVCELWLAMQKFAESKERAKGSPHR